MKSYFLAVTLIAMATSCHSTPKAYTSNGDRDVLEAVRMNDVKATKKLLMNGANINAVDESKRSLLLIATSNTNTEMARLLVKHGADVNQQANNLDSPFLYAGASGQTELVQLFLSSGGRFDVFNRYHGSALIPACERGHIETVQLLANTKNYPLDHVNRLGWTALLEAIILGDGSEKYQKIVQILKNAGAKMDIPDHDGVTPLQHAEQRGYKEIASTIKS
ncbi:ankyrin repeat domain-containing protein [Parapedobacter sp.]